MRRSIWFLLMTLASPLLADSSRTVEIFRYGCGNELGHREVTLFGNGTVRVTDGPTGDEWMGLAELSPEELAGALNRLKAEDLSESHNLSKGVEGMWIERCELRLQLPGEPLEIFRYGRYDPLTLSLSRVIQVIKDLEAKVQDLRGVEELPADYEPREQDVLKRRDGIHYRVIRFTPDNKTVELQGVTEPVYLFVLKEQMRMEFVAVISRAR